MLWSLMKLFLLSRNWEEFCYMAHICPAHSHHCEQAVSSELRSEGAGKSAEGQCQLTSFGVKCTAVTVLWKTALRVLTREVCTLNIRAWKTVGKNVLPKELALVSLLHMLHTLSLSHCVLKQCTFLHKKTEDQGNLLFYN